MTISAVYSADTYAGDGSTTTFAITFSFLSVSTNVKVSIKVDSTGVITEKTAATHYNVSGSNVVFTAGNIPASGETIIIELNPDFKQESDYSENNNFPAETVETDLDERCLEGQINNALVGNSLKIDSSLSGVTTTIVASSTNATNADKYIKFNSDGDGFEVQALSASAGLGAVIDDTTPQLGGSLDVNSQKIVSTSNGNIDIEPNGTGNVLLGNLTFDADQTIGAGQDNYVLTYDNGTGLVSLEASPSSDLVNDTTPQLGGDLDMNGNQITSPDGTDLIDIPNGSIDLQTASTSRLDITDSGVRLGAANARVTTILDEDSMSSDSATALATQQSIKAYVDAAAGGGKILQVVQGTKTDTQTVTGNTYTEITGLTASITPSSTSNKILIMASITCGNSTNAVSQGFRLQRDTTDLLQGAAASNRTLVTTATRGENATEAMGNVAMVYLDSPSSVSALTYSVETAANNSTSQSVYINRTPSDTDTANTYIRGASSIIVMEVDGT